MTEDQLKQLIKTKESQTLEFKESTGEKKEICETICAFVNSDGGIILVGIKNDGSLSKTTITEKSQTDITDLFVSFKPKIASLISFEVILLDDFDILVITVQKSKTNNNFYKNTCYKRVGASNKDITEEIIQQITNQNPDWSAQICEGATIEDLDIEAIGEFRKKLTSKDPKFAKKSDRDILVSEDLLINGCPTFGCFLLLGKYEVRNRFLSSEINHIHYLYDDEKNKIEERMDVEIPWILNLPKLFVEIEKRNYTIEDIDLFRPTEKQYDPKALEEAIANAIAHRNWQIQFWIDVRQTPQELVIHNPGYFEPDFEKVIAEGVDLQYKNPHLCTLLKKIDLMEKERRGIKRKIYTLQIAKGLGISKKQVDFDPKTQQIQKVVFTLEGKMKNIDFAKLMYKKHTQINFDEIIILDKIASGKNQFGTDINQEEFEKVKKYIKKSTGKNNKLRFKSFVLDQPVQKPIVDDSMTMKTLKSLILDFVVVRNKEEHKEFTIKEINQKLPGNYNTISVIIQNMTKQQQLIKVRYGTYILNKDYTTLIQL